MKKLYVVAVFASLLSGLVSCSTEPIDANLVSQTPTANPGGGTTGGNNGGTAGGGATNGNDTYWPMAVNNIWNFNGDPQATDPMKITSQEQINGLTYYKIDNAFQNSGSAGLTGTATIWVREDDGDYYERIAAEIPATPGMPSITVSPYEIKTFVDYLAVGETWTDTATQVTSYDTPGFPDMTSEIDILGTIMETGATVTLNGVTYNNVIKAKIQQTVYGSTTTSYLWFAKNIGPIKSQSGDENTTYTYTLTSYTLY